MPSACASLSGPDSAAWAAAATGSRWPRSSVRRSARSPAWGSTASSARAASSATSSCSAASRGRSWSRSRRARSASSSQASAGCARPQHGGQPRLRGEDARPSPPALDAAQLLGRAPQPVGHLLAGAEADAGDDRLAAAHRVQVGIGGDDPERVQRPVEHGQPSGQVALPGVVQPRPRPRLVQGLADVDDGGPSGGDGGRVRLRRGVAPAPPCRTPPPFRRARGWRTPARGSAGRRRLPRRGRGSARRAVRAATAAPPGRTGRPELRSPARGCHARAQPGRAHVRPRGPPPAGVSGSWSGSRTCWVRSGPPARGSG